MTESVDKDGQVLEITESVKVKIRSTQKNENKMGSALRVSVQEDGPAAFRYGLRLVKPEEKTEDDQIQDEGDLLIYIDKESVKNLKGAKLDFVEDVSGSGFKFDNPNQPPLLKNPLASKVQKLIDDRINPGLASHGGRATLVDIQGTKVYLQLGGGCQGCGMAGATVKEGIEGMIKQEIPEITEVVDSTDHAGGTNPYYEQGG